MSGCGWEQCTGCETGRQMEAKRPYELFYDMIPDVSHIRTSGCVVRITLPVEMLGRWMS